MKALDPEILDFYDTQVVKMIVMKYAIPEREALSAFLESKTYAMLVNPEMDMCRFGPPGIFDIWEAERVTGSPRNSNYLKV